MATALMALALGLAVAGMVQGRDCSSEAAAASVEQRESALLQCLLDADKYDRLTPPYTPSGLVDVMVIIDLRRLSLVDEAAQSLAMPLQLTGVWHDARLAWNASLVELPFVQIAPHPLWEPLLTMPTRSFLSHSEDAFTADGAKVVRARFFSPPRVSQS